MTHDPGTARVSLRPLSADDGSRVLQWRNSPAVADYMYTDHLISPEEHARWLKSAVAGPGGVFWIIQMDKRPVGLANLTRFDVRGRRCDWAYYLAEPSTRGQGVGACVEYMVLQHVFQTLQLHKLWCEVLVQNEAIWKLHQSFGFTQEALYRDHVWKGGRFWDVVGLGLLEDGWARAQPACAARLTAKGFDVAQLSITGPT